MTRAQQVWAAMNAPNATTESIAKVLTAPAQSEADALTETRFYFAEPDGCVACGGHFTASDAENGIEWIADRPAHKSCRAQYEAGYDDWRGVMTL